MLVCPCSVVLFMLWFTLNIFVLTKHNLNNTSKITHYHDFHA